MSESLGAAILGTGDVSGEHIKAFQANPRTEVRAILSRDRARAEAKAREHGLSNCRPYTDLDELLKSEDIHLVSICTPHHLHAEQGIACAQAGKHVIVEKPIALDLEGLRKLAGAVRDGNVRSVVSFVLRWNPLFETIRAILADGTIGDLYYGEVDYLHGITKNYHLYPWLRERRCGGTALLTAGCHAVDALRWFAGRDAVEVFAYANWSKGNPLEKRAAIAALCEPRLLASEKVADQVLGILNDVTASLANLPDRKSENFEVLRKGLAYCWSVAAAACPEKGKKLMEKWLKTKDKDVIWIMKENLRKNRLVKMDAEWVSKQLNLLH